MTLLAGQHEWLAPTIAALGAVAVAAIGAWATRANRQIARQNQQVLGPPNGSNIQEQVARLSQNLLDAHTANEQAHERIFRQVADHVADESPKIDALAGVPAAVDALAAQVEKVAAAEADHRRDDQEQFAAIRAQLTRRRTPKA